MSRKAETTAWKVGEALHDTPHTHPLPDTRSPIPRPVQPTPDD